MKHLHCQNVNYTSIFVYIENTVWKHNCKELLTFKSNVFYSKKHLTLVPVVEALKIGQKLVDYLAAGIHKRFESHGTQYYLLQKL